jgi:hypothetical protein
MAGGIEFRPMTKVMMDKRFGQRTSYGHAVRVEIDTP